MTLENRYIKEFTELHSVETFELSPVKVDIKIERKRDKIRRKLGDVKGKLQNVSENVRTYCNQKSFKNGVKISLIFTTGFGLMFLGPQLPAMARENFLYQGKEGIYPLPLPEKSRLAYMKTWVSPRAWRSYLSTGQLSPEFKGFLSAASITVVPFVAGGAMGLMVGGGVSYLVHEAAFQILTSRHKSYAAVATAVSNDRFEDLSRCYIYLRELRIDRSFVGLPGVVGEVKEITDYLKQLPVLFPDISSKLIIKK